MKLPLSPLLVCWVKAPEQLNSIRLLWNMPNVCELQCICRSILVRCITITDRAEQSCHHHWGLPLNHCVFWTQNLGYMCPEYNCGTCWTEAAKLSMMSTANFLKKIKQMVMDYTEFHATSWILLLVPAQSQRHVWKYLKSTPSINLLPTVLLLSSSLQ